MRPSHLFSASVEQQFNEWRGLQVSKKCFPPDISFTPSCLDSSLRELLMNM